MENLILFSKLLWRLCVSALLIQTLYLSFKLPLIMDSVADRFDRQVGTVTTNAIDRIDARLEQLNLIVDRRTGQGLSIANEQADSYRRMIYLTSVTALGRLDSRLGEMTGSVQHLSGLREDILPAVQGANLLMRRDALPAQILGLAAASKVTMGQTAQAAIEFREALPKMLLTADGVGANLRENTLRSNLVLEDTDVFIKRMTPPKFPGWLRWTLGLVPPITQGGAAAVGIGAAVGVFR